MDDNFILIRGPFGVLFWVRVDVSEVTTALEETKGRLKDLRPLWRKIANVMRKSFAESFRQGGRPRWKSLERGTVFGKAMNPRAVYSTMLGRARIRRLEQVRAGGSRPARSLSNVLVLSGEYRDSWTTKSADHVENINKDGLEIGSKHRLAAIHEYGTGVHGSKGKAFLIKPVRAKSLRWFGPYGPVFSKGVMNPGVPPRPVAIVQDEDWVKIAREATDHVMGANQ